MSRVKIEWRLSKTMTWSHRIGVQGLDSRSLWFVLSEGWGC